MTYIQINMGNLWDKYCITNYDIPEGSCCGTDVVACLRGNDWLASLLCTGWTPFQVSEGVQRKAISVRDRVFV